MKIAPFYQLGLSSGCSI